MVLVPRPATPYTSCSLGKKSATNISSPTPDVDEAEVTDAFRILSLQPLVRMKLTSFRDKDRMHLRDLIGVGLIDAEWPSRFPPELGAKLQQLLDNPDG